LTEAAPNIDRAAVEGPATQFPRRMAPNVVLDQRYSDDTIDLTYLFWVWIIWSWIPLLAAAFGAYLGYRSLQDFTPQAVANMLVLPVSNEGGGAPTVLGPTGLGAAAAQFGIQLASQQTSVSTFERLKLILGSNELAELLDAKYGLLRRVYASSWDDATQTWTRPSGKSFEDDQRRKAFLRQNLWSPPNLGMLAGYISGTVKVEPVPAASFYRISVQHVDGEYALWLLQTVFTEADNLLRERDRQDSRRRRAFIEKQMESRTILYMQEALRNLLSQELSREISLEANPSYSATIVEAPYIANARTEPNPTLVFGVPMVVLAIGGFLLVTLVAVVRRERA
jgi:hypothetical protein